MLPASEAVTGVTDYSSGTHHFLDAAHDRLVQKIALTAIVDQADNST
jgi:hypothetical protein